MIRIPAPLRSSLITLIPLIGASPSAGAETVLIDAARDNTLYENATGSVSNGAGSFLFSGRTNGFGAPVGLRRILISFDVATQIPAGSVIESVELRLTVTRTAADTFTHSVHRATQDWGEGSSNASGFEGMGTAATAPDATWLDAISPGTTWTTPGGDYVSTSSAIRDVAGDGTYAFGSTFQMIADVQDMLDNPATNYGWVVLGGEMTQLRSAKQFGSRSHGFAGNRPVLSVEFTGPPIGTTFCPGVGCPCNNDGGVGGCTNSSGTGGGLAVTAGTTSVSNDTLVLTATGMPPGNSGLFFMGADVFLPIQVGDGLACTGGLFRFPPGAVSVGGEFSLSGIVAKAPAGQVVPGVSRGFQAWTRDVLCGPPPSPCPSPCGMNSSLSNGVSVVFTP